MGAWAFGSFSNDDALDWLGEVTESDDPNRIGEALSRIVDAPAEHAVESWDCCAALAAAEFVAASNRKPAPDFPEEAAGFLQAHSVSLVRLDRELARRAVDRVASKSELREQFDTYGTLNGWLAEISSLRERLTS